MDREIIFRVLEKIGKQNVVKRVSIRLPPLIQSHYPSMKIRSDGRVTFDIDHRCRSWRLRGDIWNGYSL